MNARDNYLESIKSSLYEIVKDKALQRGNFTLASGVQSSYYFDSKPVLFDQYGMRLFATWIIEHIYTFIDRSKPIAIGGPEIGAIPIATAVATLATFNVKPFVVRKSPKDHGTQKLIEGDISPDDTVILVEDVVTTGGSLKKAADAVRAIGNQHCATFCLIQRNIHFRDTMPVFPVFYDSEFIEST